MAERIYISSGTIWETKVGYSRAVKMGNQIFISGTTAVRDDGSIVGGGNPYTQSLYILEKIEKFLEGASAGINDIVRTRIFVTNIIDWEEIGRAHGKYFSKVKPAVTTVEISRLIDENLLVEIEVVAVISEE